jgi:hypothetical protein
MANRPTFEMGLVLAGAVSAGAYTAGAVDFLIEALDSYDAEKNKPGWTGPTHDVRLPVIAGASAGGMTAGIMAVELFRELDHVWTDRPEPAPAGNRLYSSWVKDISIERLLDRKDLQGARQKEGVVSALCCDILDEIVNAAFLPTPTVKTRAWVGSAKGDPLKIILTVSNLRGVVYSFDMQGSAPDAYAMTNHGDYIAFDVTPGGTGPTVFDPLKLDEVPQSFKAACLATGAFPVGLAPRKLSRIFGDYTADRRVIYRDTSCTVHSVPPAKLEDPAAAYDFVAVDGGMIDNEPFELARRTLSGGAGIANVQDGDKALKAVLLIDPFPTRPKLPNFDPSRTLASVVPALLPTLMDQARFKPDELGPALDGRIYSRFVISPERVNDRNLLQIACGALGGFSGFLHESFRRHDYLLGRRNAQAFLRWHFALPENNPLFNAFPPEQRDPWYVTMPPDAPDPQRRAQFATTALTVSPTKNGLPIIPLTPAMLKEVEISAGDLPQPQAVSTWNLSQLVRARADIVLSTLVDQDLSHLLSIWPPAGYVLRKAAIVYASQVVTNKAINSIKDALKQISASFPRTG